MCDGVTQGTEGMELSLFSRDVIAMATAVALSHDMFDAALMLGVCDKIVPTDRRAAFWPFAGVCARWPDADRHGQQEKAQVREQAAQGLVGRRPAGIRDEATTPGTCTFYGTPTATRCCWKPWPAGTRHGIRCAVAARCG
jgi:phosphogluconate dehydratase